MDVCADASPEGNLPLDFQADEKAYLNSQMVLRHSFRTIEAATECLGIVATIKIEQNTVDCYEYCLELGEMLSSFLTRIRHRGAFSTVHNVFDAFCKSLPSSKDSRLHQLLEIWLIGLLDQITNLQVSVTRRSAGLPVAILSIVTSSRNETLQQQFLDMVMNTCITVGNSTVHDRVQELDLAQVHAMNVQRVLISDASLSRLIRDYLPTFFEHCIKSFSSPIFPIRNCAAMLFSVLMDKSFGTIRNKTDKKSDQLVVAKEFFMKFPAMYDLLLQELKVAVQTINSTDLHPALYPILCLLCRLKPALDETSDSKFSLLPFLNLVLKCHKSALWKVREIAATAASCIAGEKEEALGELLYSILDTFQNNISPNDAHGLALQVSALLEMNHKALVTMPEISEKIALAVQYLSKPQFAASFSVFLKMIIEYFPLDSKSTHLQKCAMELSCKVLRGDISIPCCPKSTFDTAAQIYVKNSLMTNSFTEILEILKLVNVCIQKSILKALVGQEWNIPNQLIHDYCHRIIKDANSNNEIYEEALALLLKLDVAIDFESTKKRLETKVVPYTLQNKLIMAQAKSPMGTKELQEFGRQLFNYSDALYPSSTRITVAKVISELTHKLDKTVLYLLLEKLFSDDEPLVQNIAMETMMHLSSWKVFRILTSSTNVSRPVSVNCEH